MTSKHADIALGALGFGLCKTAISVAYITAMGSVSSTVGFVSELDFMFAMNAISFATALAIIALVRAGRLRPGALSQVPAVIALLVGFFLSATGVMAGLPFAATAVFYGVLCGFALTVLNAAWLEAFVAAYGVYQIVGGLIVQCVLVSVLPLLGSLAASVLSIVAVVVSACLLVRLKRMLSFAERDELLPANRGDRLSLLQAFLCLFVLVGVVGILHTTVLGSQSESIVGDVNMWMPLVAATAITALVAGLTMRHPDPTAVYKGCLPAMLAILSLLPFFGEALGGLAGLVMITCYDVCGMVFLLFIVDRARTLRMSSYVLSSVYLGGSGLFLVIGLSIGGVLGALSADYGLSLLTLLAFAAIYPLAIVLVVALRRAHPQDASSAAAGEGGEGAPSAVRAGLEERCAAVAARFDLTPREREILGYLARGRTAKFIAEELVISENTAWAHIKRVYAKTGVHSKQELMSVVEQQGRSR